MLSETMWCVVSVKGGIVHCSDVFAHTKKRLIEKWLEHWPSRPGNWKEFYRRGYRCVKVRVEEIK